MISNLALFVICIFSTVGNISGFIVNKFRHIDTRLSAVSSIAIQLKKAPYDDIIPFLSEHVQPADQMLFIGASSDLCLQLSRNGFGTINTGFILVVDSDTDNLESCKIQAQSDPILLKNMVEGRLKFAQADLTNMPEVCKQSVFDAIVDYGALDSLLSQSTISQAKAVENTLKCIDHLQDSVRLGNILVCLSTLDKETFCSPFSERFGWVQELDGDPGDLSAWYRGKSNLQATKSNFAKHGLKMYVYTNTDNC
eukprot:gene1253-2427_t